ncbi:MAG: methyltransferase [Bacteroidales bacterium]|nr:methyltransferase [Bacteroidales bacterium]
MGNDFFRFKQFTVRQGGAAMKVGVDSVLLGAWVSANDPARILDVGAGTGLLALMMAQRYPEAMIDAVEIDPEACRQALENIANSPWRDRIRVICGDFRDDAGHGRSRYDLIISNPPYFTASLKPSDAKRHAARHNDSLPHGRLLAESAKLLADAGVLAVTLPSAEALRFIDKAAACGLFVKRRLHVQSIPSKPAFRILVELSKTKYPQEEETLCIERIDRLDFTSEYKDLTRAFYLKF